MLSEVDVSPQLRLAPLVLALACNAPVYVPREPPPAPADTDVFTGGTDVPTTTGASTGSPTGTGTGTGSTSVPTSGGLPCSLESNTASTVEVRNLSGEPLSFYWLAFDCSEWFLRPVAVDETTVEYTYLTHTFFLTDGAGTRRADITIADPAGEILEVF